MAFLGPRPPAKLPIARIEVAVFDPSNLIPKMQGL